MRYFYIGLMFFFFTLIVSIMSKFLKLNKNPASLRVITSRGFGVTVYARLQARLQHLIDRRFARMNDSAKADYAKNFKWKRQVESVTRKLQREQREALRAEVQRHTYSASLNLDSLVLFIKLSTFCLFLGFSVFFTNYHYLLSMRKIKFLLLVVGFWALDVVFGRLVLRESRFWFWRPWPAIFHVYAKGFWHFKTGMVLFTYYLIPSFWVPFTILSVVFLGFRFNHSPFMRYAYNVWGGYWRGQFWYYIMVFYFQYVRFLKPFVLLLTRLLKPGLVWLWSKVPSFRLPYGWSWL